MTTTKKRNFLIGLIFSLIVIGYVLSSLDWRQVAITFRELNWGYLIAAFAVYLVNYILRALRFKMLLQFENVSFRKLLGITHIYGMYLYLMPAKSGELSYPILLKNRLNISLGSSAATLVTARYFDFATIALFLPGVMIAFWEQMPHWIRVSALAFGGIFALASGVVAWWLRKPPRTSTPASIFARHKIIDRIIAGAESLRTHLGRIHQRGRYWHLWLVTIAIWLCVQTNFYLIILSLGFSLSIFQIMVVSIIMVPMTLLPLQGFANLGTHEIGWVAAFRIFEQPQSVALNIAVSSHIILLAFILLLGAIGSLLLVNQHTKEI